MTSMSVLDLGVIRVGSFISDTGLVYLIFVLVYLLSADLRSSHLAYTCFSAITIGL